MENQPNAGQLELALNLSHCKRNQLITSLNELSTILQSNKPIPADVRQRTLKKIEESTLLLVYLSPFEVTQLTDVPIVFEKGTAGERTIELSRAHRSNAVDYQNALKDAVQFDSLITGATKRNLITENKRILHQPLDLTKREQNGESDKDKHSEKIEPPSKKQMGRLLLSFPLIIIS